MTLHLPDRRGARPETVGPAPHEQVSQIAPSNLQEELFGRVAALPGVIVGASFTSVPDSRGFHLEPDSAVGPDVAFMARAAHAHDDAEMDHPGPDPETVDEVLRARTEFAHLHPERDGSLHVRLPGDIADAAEAAGWIERHPVVPHTLMVYGPRDEEELEVVWQIVLASYRFGRGEITGEHPAHAH
jgi:hypothetical protein